ncbi:MAG: hypothetical protein U1E86_13470 [Burkholderiaceae bacterium]
MKKIVRTLSAACACALAVAAGAARAQPSTYTYTPISRVMEANVRVAALAIDAGRPLQMSWKLERAFSVSAELAPLKSYAGDVIGNSAAAKAPRTVTRAYTSAKPEIGSPSEGRYVIVEMDPEDFNASSWYMGFNPGIRQILPYKDAMSYEVRLLHELNFAAPNASPTKPGAAVDTLKTDAVFKPGPGRIATADGFSQAVFEMPENASIRFLAYNLHKPADVPAGRKVPLVVFLHGSGQSHDYAAFPNDPRADVLSPLLANQGGTTWVENAREKAFVLVPQAPARDTRDGDNEGGWRSADTQKMLLALVDKLVAENPSIDVDRLYLTGLSMGAMGSWKILNSPDPKISRKFAAAALIAGIPKDVFFPARTETPAQRAARIRGASWTRSTCATLRRRCGSPMRTPTWSSTCSRACRRRHRQGEDRPARGHRRRQGASRRRQRPGARLSCQEPPRRCWSSATSSTSSTAAIASATSAWSRGTATRKLEGPGTDRLDVRRAGRRVAG